MNRISFLKNKNLLATSSKWGAQSSGNKFLRFNSLLFVLLMFIPVVAFGQQQVNVGDKDESTLNLKKVDYSLNTGTSIFSMGSMGSGSMYYVAPEFSYQFSPKFRFRGGVMFTQQNFKANPDNLDMKSNYQYYVPSGPSTTVYASGDYQVNSRLSLTGTLIKNFSDNRYSQNGFDNSYQMMSMGLNYKITDHLHFGAGVSLYQGSGLNSLYYNNPYMYRYNFYNNYPGIYSGF